MKLTPYLEVRPELIGDHEKYTDELWFYRDILEIEDLEFHEVFVDEYGLLYLQRSEETRFLKMAIL